MPGVKGRSGGKREGAGRKPNTVEIAGAESPLAFLEAVMNDPAAPIAQRVRSAIAAAQYRHVKKSDGGKKDEQADKAKKAGAGKFAAAAAPLKLVSR